MELGRIPGEIQRIVTKSKGFALARLADFRFLTNRELNIPVKQRLWLLRKSLAASRNLRCPHKQAEVWAYATTILTTPVDVRGCFVEAGCYKGCSTAKFSLAAKLAERDLVVFDSFEGIPEHDEPHEESIFGRPVGFRKGSFHGALDEVRRNILKYGELGSCRMVKGWFEETMPDFNEPVAGIYLDVDLASSTRTCLKYLYPLLESGGTLYSQDGHLPLVIEVFDDDDFWRDEVGYAKPRIEGLGKQKLIRIAKH